MAKRFKLHRLTTEDCYLALAVSDSGSPIIVKAANIPVIFWPDGRVCWEANTWMVRLWKEGKSTRNHGGTLATYAYNLAPFLRFLHDRKLAFGQIRDSHIFEYARLLAEERDPRDTSLRIRGQTQTNVLIRQALTFLIFYQSLYLPKPIVADNGSAAIRISYRSFIVRGQPKNYIWHDSMGPNDVPKDIKPIGKPVMDALLRACGDSAKHPYVVNRRRTVQKLLSEAGCRRIELTWIKLEHIQAALDTERNGMMMLQLYTAKRREQMGHISHVIAPTRLVPVTRATMEDILKFIKVYRAPVLKKLQRQGKIAADPGWLFMSNQGKYIEPDTLSRELATIRQKAGITEAATLRMYRHRFVTLQVIHRIKQFQGQKLPMDLAQTILAKVASLTGHKKVESLWHYLDLAFEEMGVWDAANDAVTIRMQADALMNRLHELQDEVRRTKKPLNTEIRRIYDELNAIISCAIKNLPSNPANDEARRTSEVSAPESAT